MYWSYRLFKIRVWGNKQGGGINTDQIARFPVQPRRYHTRLPSYMFYRTQSKLARLDLCGLEYVRAREKDANVSCRVACVRTVGAGIWGRGFTT